MSEVSEQEAKAASDRLKIADDALWDSLGEDDEQAIENEIDACETLLIRFARQELNRREAAQSARQQPITPEWCLVNGAFYREPYYVFDNPVRVTVRPIGRGDAWLVFIDERMIDDWSATCVGQVDELRKALRGGA